MGGRNPPIDGDSYSGVTLGDGDPGCWRNGAPIWCALAEKSQDAAARSQYKFGPHFVAGGHGHNSARFYIDAVKGGVVGLEWCYPKPADTELNRRYSNLRR